MRCTGTDAAFEEHKSRPYVTAFETDRRPYVLATNVIELGLQQAKVSPLPSISDLLSDTGYDLLSDTGFGQPGFGPRSADGSSPPRGPDLPRSPDMPRGPDRPRSPDRPSPGRASTPGRPGSPDLPGSESGLSGPPGAYRPR